MRFTISWSPKYFCLLLGLGSITTIAQAQIEARLKVGLIAPLSGPMAPFGDSFVKGVEIAMAEFAHQNPQMVGNVTVLKRDSAGLGEKTESEALNLVKVEKVDLLMGELTNTNTYALAKVAQEYQKPLISPFGTSRAISKSSSYIYTSTYGEHMQAQAMAVYAARVLHHRQAFVIADKESSYSQALGKAFQGKFQSEGRPLAKSFDIWGDKPDYTTLLAGLKSEPVDVIYAPLPLSLAKPLVDLLRQNGFRGTILGCDLWDNPQIQQVLNVDQNGILFYPSRFSVLAPDSTTKTFISAFQSRYQKAPDYWAAMGYDGMLMTLAAFKQSSSSRNVALAKALGTLMNIPSTGGALTMGPDGQSIKPVIILSPVTAGPKFVNFVTL